MGISSLFPVQVGVWQETIGPGSFERDLCINSPTGSGKTLAYALPIVQMLSTRAVRCLRALVVLPTRDLALQVIILFHIFAVMLQRFCFKGILLPSNSVTQIQAQIEHEPSLQFVLTLSQGFFVDLCSVSIPYCMLPYKLLQHCPLDVGHL